MNLQADLDFEALGAALDFSLDEFLHLVNVYVTSAGREVEKIDAANAHGDGDAMARAAHSLKGSSGNLGFRGMYELTRALESAAKKSPPAVEKGMIQAVRAEFAKINAGLNAFGKRP